MKSTILISVDSLRLDYLDEMPKTTKFFDATYTNAFATYPSTIGSFPSIIGGVYPVSVGLEKTNSVVPNIEHSQKLGVTTNVLTSGKYGYDAGFTHFNSMTENESITTKLGRKIPDGRVYSILNSSLQTARKVSRKFTAKETNSNREYPRAREVIDTIKQTIDKERNFFVWAHFMDVHHPYHSEKYSTVSRNDAYQLTKQVLGKNGGTKSEKKQTKNLYEDCVRQLDDDLSNLYSWAPDDTRIVFCADHGEHLGEKDHWGHHEYLDNVLLNVPFLTRNISKIQSNVISLIDIPSILLGNSYNNGTLQRDYAYSMCDEKKSVTDGTNMLTNEDTVDDHTLQTKLNNFNPERAVRQAQANTDDLEALGYL